VTPNQQSTKRQQDHRNNQRCPVSPGINQIAHAFFHLSALNNSGSFAALVAICSASSCVNFGGPFGKQESSTEK